MTCIAALAMVMAARSAGTEPPPASSLAPGVTMPTNQLNDPRLGVDVTFAGPQPLHFVLDTASTRSVVARDVADARGLAAGPRVTVANIGGSDRVDSVIIPELHVAGLARRNITAPALLRTNLGGDGLLGLDILQGQQMTIDFKNKARVTIAPSARRRAREDDTARDADLIVVRAESRFGELIVTNAEIEGHRVSVIIDTGSEDSIGNSALRALVAGRIRHTAITPVSLLGVTGRTVPGEFTQIGRFTIGGVEVANLPVAFADVQTFRQFRLDKRPAILLGMGTLRLMDRVTLDFPNRTIEFSVPRKAAVAAR